MCIRDSRCRSIFVIPPIRIVVVIVAHHIQGFNCAQWKVVIRKHFTTENTSEKLNRKSNRNHQEKSSSSIDISKRSNSKNLNAQKANSQGENRQKNNQSRKPATFQTPNPMYESNPNIQNLKWLSRDSTKYQPHRLPEPISYGLLVCDTFCKTISIPRK